MASVENSTWYIVAIICCWFSSWLAFKQNKLNPVIVVFGMILLYMILISKFINDAVYYNTIIAYPIGFIFAHYENKLYDFLQKYYWAIPLTVCVILTIGIKLYTWFLICEIWVFAFMVFLVLSA